PGGVTRLPILYCHMARYDSAINLDNLFGCLDQLLPSRARTRDHVSGYPPADPILLARWCQDRRAGNGILIEGSPLANGSQHIRASASRGWSALTRKAEIAIRVANGCDGPCADVRILQPA